VVIAQAEAEREHGHVQRPDVRAPRSLDVDEPLDREHAEQPL
jgi:hypothetical protein